MPVQLHVDVPAWKQSVEKRYSDPAERAKALAAVDELDRQTKVAVTDATRAIYRYGLLLALGGLICSLLIPQIPLRKARERVPVAD